MRDSKMQYNVCSNCMASDGRAGNLWSSQSKGYEMLCVNCRDTLKSGNLIIHSDLIRSDEEIDRTVSLITALETKDDNAELRIQLDAANRRMERTRETHR